MISLPRYAFLACLGAVVAGCTSNDQISDDTQPFDEISESETVTLLGTEPFWDFTIIGDSATYKSPENLDGSTFAVTRFAGNNGLGYSGELDGKAVQIAVTPGTCSDGMSDRDYPYTATINWGESTLRGCGYTDNQPFTGDEAP